MSFNKNNPNAVGKIMGYLKQLSTEMGGSEQTRRGQGDEERLYRARGPKYARVPSRPTLSASTTCTSLATSCGSQGTLAPNYAAIPENVSTESSSEDEQDSFEKTRRHFQQLRQISLGNEFKYKMEMEIKSAKDENLRNSVPFVKQLSTDSNKIKNKYAINGDSQPYNAPTTQSLFLWTQVFAALAVSMGSMIVGFSSGYTSPAQSSMNATLILGKEEISWIGGIMPLAALAGGILGGPLIEGFGRKLTIIGTAIPFFLGWMLIANANGIAMVLAGRAFCGLSVGVGSLAFPVYLGETIQPEVRGSLGLLPTALGNTGILLAFFAGTKLDWSHLAFLGGALAIPFFLLMLITPETPRWYFTKNRAEDARKALQWLRGKNINIEKEMRELTRSQAEADLVRGNQFKQLFAVKYMPAVLISLGLMFFQQLSGINAVIFYASTIFESAGSSIDPKLSSVIIGVVNFISTFIATVLIDRLGRKILLYISSVSMILTLVTLGSYYYLQNVGVDVKPYGWLPLACLIIYVLGFSIGFGPIPWLMLGEILPSKIRGNAASLATGFNWTCTFIVTKTFPNIIQAIYMHGTVWLFSVICLIGLFFVIFFVPETRGKSLEEIEKKLTGGSVRIRNINGNKHMQNGC
ncbi:Facilitated trehalose transporter Tret1 [Papilio machaon]|uniref:Facilitated trehalose transporter Tret1 n=1 Tax=Papilio machaon TaxID=76193 RepID=A0A194RFW2_PAPMA|nr:facilitated trehalose transporter Tret1 [Papilio machaon]KPJ16703.1 Facilitated trehalose transporter Tret1 [Papilio machaon]